LLVLLVGLGRAILVFLLVDFCCFFDCFTPITKTVPFLVEGSNS